KRLLKKWSDDIKVREFHAAFYDSQNPQPQPPQGASRVYDRLLRMSRTPWARLVVDIVAERMEMQGLDSTDSAQVASEAWRVMKRNHIERVQSQVHREALAVGTSYVSVWGARDTLTKVAFESAMSVTHEAAAGDPTETIAAIKVWYDSVEGHVRVNLYRPEA